MATIDYQKLVIDSIKNKTTHKWYDRVVKDSILYTQLSTGEDSDKLLKQFVRREDEEMFKQRVNLTQEITSAVIKTLSDVNYKIPRSPGLTKNYEYKEDQDKQKKLHEKLEQFNGIYSWDDYLERRILALNDTDPNAWIVIESNQTDGTERLSPYPFEVSSEEAIDFEFINNILQWLLVKNTIKYIDESDKEKDGFKYTLYEKKGWTKLEQTKFSNSPTQSEDFIPVETDKGLIVKIGNDAFYITSGTYNTGGVVPAFRIGWNADKYTKEQTLVPSWNAAISYLLKTIKAVSELDLATALHVFLQKVTQVPGCNKCRGTGVVECSDCESGRKDCPTCNGTGQFISSSTQDAITIKLPDNPSPDQVVDLTNLVHYISFDTGIPQWQNEYIDSLILKCYKVVFNSKALDKVDINKTATGVGASVENEYDALWGLANTHVRVWKFGVNTISHLTGLNDGLSIITNVSKDLKLKTKEDYLYDLQLATTAKASQGIQNNIEKEIVRIDFEDNPIEFNKHVTQDYFFPFSGKNDTEIASIIPLLPIDDPNRVLWIYYGIIYQEIELEYGSEAFYVKLNKKEQKKIIDIKVQEKTDFLMSKNPTLDLNDDQPE